MLKRLLAVIDEYHLDLAPIVRVDGAGRVQNGDAMADERGRSAAGLAPRNPAGSSSAMPVGTSARSPGQGVSGAPSCNGRREIEPRCEARSGRTAAAGPRHAAARYNERRSCHCCPSPALLEPIAAARTRRWATSSLLSLRPALHRRARRSNAQCSCRRRIPRLRAKRRWRRSNRSPCSSISSDASATALPVSAAKPITRPGRFSVRFATVLRISGFSTSRISGAAALFLILPGCTEAARQSATAALNMAISAGSAASTASSILLRRLDMNRGHARRVWQRAWPRHQRHARAKPGRGSAMA